MNFQKTYVLGRVAHTPEMKALPNGGNVTTFSMATNRYWKDNDGKEQEAVEWHNMIAFGKTAELLAKYVEGGQCLFIEGRNQTRNWEDKDTGKKMYRTEVMVEKFQFGPKSQARENAKAGGDNQEASTAVKTGGYDGPLADQINYDDAVINIDDIPF